MTHAVWWPAGVARACGGVALQATRITRYGWRKQHEQRALSQHMQQLQQMQHFLVSLVRASAVRR
ncbi:MAG: hypothetical protein EOQ86_06545 [Mesorhizobium sp.]|uniref:hypothetical protein n=1 Tax=Mesorhizobium sp. TaxID=1871066 RepID=UPI000FE9DA11|nr:hypothetical protein [Mesorhizobium sp.]RWH81212.1 MAG: hypothetical protein EOQ85_09245 [Mesorhizobium sp.]RWH85815.1 MAG: hypothetical protein EOQ86_06545 [Mesorhizobium sp.]RWH91072.1 MAG: hypothetical protein EOQ87_10200 [Mesorhizobium sp.]RWH99754.1 MAG: hypothetical protein EOQ88_10305 [Mesorhizobium sp.]RWI04004.1 MAG: hypothetical protein EOQ89_10605 [Mesorhizobium sp.]